MKTILHWLVFWGGVFSVATVSAATVRYVNVGNSSPVSPFTSWATAATSIQSAIDIAASGDVILVTNGVYQSGSKSMNGLNRVAVDKAVAVQSVNGPEVTIIDAAQAMRCVYLVDGAALSGFTLTNANSGGSGAGTYCESTNAIISNCHYRNNVTHGD